MTQPVGVIDGVFAGTDPHAVYALQLGEIEPPNIPTIAELPAVGPHATHLGKVVANMGLPFELRSYGWQLQRGSRISSADQRRARAHQHSVIQALVDVAQDRHIPEVAIRVMGPVDTMIHGMLPSGQRIMQDPFARQDLAAAWTDAIGNLSNEIYDVVGARTTVLVTEAQAHRAAAGKIRTVSGADVERSLDRNEIRDIWEQATSLDATVILEPATQFLATAAQLGPIGMAWPTGRSQRTEDTWQLVDQLVSTQQPVALHLPGQSQGAESYAEGLIQQYLDWGLDVADLQYLRIVHRIDGGTQRQVGAGLEWFQTVMEHATGYLTTL